MRLSAGAKSLRGSCASTESPRQGPIHCKLPRGVFCFRRITAEGSISMQDTRPLLLHTDFPQIARLGVETLQVNLGYRCNQSCAHCHVNAGPRVPRAWIARL